MRPPSDLKTSEGEKAWRNAVETLEADGRDPVSLLEPINRYARAADLAQKIREEWIADGSPTTTLGGVTGKLIVGHPMVKAMNDAQEVAGRFWRDLIYPPRRGQVGRPRGAASAPDRSVPPKIRLIEGGKGEG